MKSNIIQFFSFQNFTQLFCNSDEIQINSEKKSITLPAIFRELKKDFTSDLELIEWICQFTSLSKHSSLMEIARDVQGTIQYTQDTEENMFRVSTGTISAPVLVESSNLRVLSDQNPGVIFSPIDPDSFDRLHDYYESEIIKAKVFIPDLLAKKGENTVPDQEEDKIQRRKNVKSVTDDVSLNTSFFFNTDSSFLSLKGTTTSNQTEKSPRRRGNQATFNTISTHKLQSSASQPKKRLSVQDELESSSTNVTNTNSSSEPSSSNTLKKNSKEPSVEPASELPKTDKSFLKSSFGKEGGSFFLSSPKPTSPILEPSSEEDLKKSKSTGIKNAFKRFVKGDNNEVVDLPELEGD